MDGAKDLTRGNVTKLILAFYFPMFFTNFLQQFYAFADTAIVGNGLGDNALAAVGNMTTLTFFIFGFAIGLGNGFSVVIAQFFGEKSYEKMRHAYAAAICLAVFISIILTAFSVIFLEDALKLIKADENIIADSLKYGTIVFGGTCATIAYNTSASILRALGDSKTPLKAIIASSILNIALDYFFIMIVGTGVEGAGFATVFSQLVSSYICIKKLINIDVIRIERKHFAKNGRYILELLRNGIPMAFMNSLTAIGCMVVQYFVNGFGVVFTAAYAACSKYLNIGMQPAFTVSNALSAFVSQNYGAREYGRIKKGILTGCMIAGVTYVTLGGLMFFGARPLAMVLLHGEESIKLAVQFLRICGVTICAVDFLFVFRSAVQGMGYPRIPMLSGMLEMLLRILTIVFLVKIIGFRAAALAETFAWIGALLLNASAFFIYYRKLILNDNKEKNKIEVF